MRYAAFISYAHSDEAMGRKIQNALETYALPKDINISKRDRLKPIFRDVTELTAHHSLSEKIKDAVSSSRFLIVLCSPAAKTSHWVNEEIKLFRELHGEGSILTVIIKGDPNTAFPPALTENGREPLAANMTSREGFRLGVTQLAASMLGVGLDMLLQRDSKRRRHRLQLITASAVTFSAIMGGMAWTAIDARNAAETSRAEAEKMVEFMITDLKEELEPVGRLAILDNVGVRVTDYYDAIPLSDMDDDRLTRQARARHILGQVALDQVNAEKAHLEIQAAYNATEEVLRRQPENEDAIYAHAQSAYWIGRLFFQNKNHLKALEHWQVYNDLCQKIYQKDPTNPKWILEAAWGVSNLGFIKIHLNQLEDANTHLNHAIELNTQLLSIDKSNSEWIKELSNAYMGAANLALEMDNTARAKKWVTKNIELLEQAHKIDPSNMDVHFRLVRSKIELQMPYRAELKLNCAMSNVDNLLRALKNIISSDPDNENWNRNYLKYKTKYDQLCLDN